MLLMGVKYCQICSVYLLKACFGATNALNYYKPRTFLIQMVCHQYNGFLIILTIGHHTKSADMICNLFYQTSRCTEDPKFPLPNAWDLWSNIIAMELPSPHIHLLLELFLIKLVPP